MLKDTKQGLQTHLFTQVFLYLRRKRGDSIELVLTTDVISGI